MTANTRVEDMTPVQRLQNVLDLVVIANDASRAMQAMKLVDAFMSDVSRNEFQALMASKSEAFLEIEGTQNHETCLEMALFLAVTFEDERNQYGTVAEYFARGLSSEHVESIKDKTMDRVAAHASIVRGPLKV